MSRCRRWYGIGLTLALALSGLAAGRVAARASHGAGPTHTPHLRFTDYRLKNGLRVLLAPDHAAPVVAVSVTYNVGSRNERPGRTGFAHLFEHMMFQGSANVGKGEHPMLISDNGGTMNGTTNQDRTNYFEALPANQLALALFLEADRMRSLDVSQANLDNQRAVVQEEKRQSYDNQPYGHLFENLLEMAYTSFAYKHTTIGSMEDLDAATLEDLRAFFKTYYAPDNAVLAIAGDFETKRAKKLVEQYFGPIPRQPAPPPVEISEAPAAAERRRTITDPLARLPRWTAVYRTVPGSDPDYYPLSMLAGILGRGRTARLYPALVEKQIAIGVSAFETESRGPGLFQVGAALPPDARPDAVEPAIDAEIARVQSEGITREELEKARNEARTGAVRSLESALGRANQLSLYAVYYNDPDRINDLLPRLEAVTADDVRRVARKYLVRTNRSVVIVQPAPVPRAAGAPPS